MPAVVASPRENARRYEVGENQQNDELLPVSDLLCSLNLQITEICLVCECLNKHHEGGHKHEETRVKREDAGDNNKSKHQEYKNSEALAHEFVTAVNFSISCSCTSNTNTSLELHDDTEPQPSRNDPGPLKPKSKLKEGLDRANQHK